MRRGAGLRARSVAGVAARRDIDLNLAAAACKGVFEPDFHVVAQVGAARGAALLLPAAAESRPEDRFENIADVAEFGAATKAAARAAAILERRLAEAVVGCALLRVFEAIIGFVDGLEPRFAVAAPRILVGVVFHRELAVAGFQRRVVSAALAFEQFVIIDVERHGLSAPSAPPRREARRGEFHAYFLSSSTSENSASTTSSSAFFSSASAVGDAAACCSFS